MDNICIIKLFYYCEIILSAYPSQFHPNIKVNRILILALVRYGW